MGNEITIRQAVPGDYSGFREVEEAAWQNTGIEVISEEIFNTWIDVFPEGALLALVDGKIRAHIFSQICDFYPDDHKDDRSWAEITDNGTAQRTHNPNGNALYVVSISSRFSGAAIALMNKSMELGARLGKNFFAGACRMPGLQVYKKEKALSELVYQNVMDYACKVDDTEKGRRVGKKQYIDPVLTTFLNLRKKRVRVCRVVENYFPDEQSYNWACLISFEITDNK